MRGMAAFMRASDEAAKLEAERIERLENKLHDKKIYYEKLN